MKLSAQIDNSKDKRVRACDNITITGFRASGLVFGGDAIFDPDNCRDRQPIQNCKKWRETKEPSRTCQRPPVVRVAKGN